MKTTLHPFRIIIAPSGGRICVLVCALAVLFSVAPDASGQSAPTDTSAQSSADQPSVQALKKDYENAVTELRESLKAIKKAGADYYQNKSTVAFEYREKWEIAAVATDVAYRRVRDAAFALFFALDNPDAELMNVVQRMNRKLNAQGQLTQCYLVTKKLLDLRPGNPELIKIMGRVSIMTNDFDRALDFYQSNKSETEAFGMPERAVYSFVESLHSRYQRELELQKSDAQGEPLPHAIVETTKGTLVIELFENQAPETVGNFVNLVQTGFYDRIIFHRVIRNIMADAGRMTMNRPQPVGYTIHDESKRPDARDHYRGSVTMVLNNDEENTGAAEFRIMLVPGPNMNGKNTVFGRVISGLEVLDSIQETFTINEDEGKEEFVTDVIPDTIKSITVKRLRDHDYEPNRVKE